ERRCPRIYMECKHDSDCLADCVCLEHGICGG
nr:serine proteinase inhibitor I, trypsin inhibitor I, LLTI-I [Lagenaria leucantha=gourd, Rusby, var. Gourda Makino, seeds, Peptide, 31 aa] [Lagenaria siceraria]